MTHGTTTVTQCRPRPSGRFLLRIDPGLHAALKGAAREAGLSLNEYCGRKLSAPGEPQAGPFEEAIGRAASTFGDGLVGVALFGSCARDEAAEGSDVDLLVVLDPAVPIVRALYHAWDARPVRWGSRLVDPHFAHPPEEGVGPSGLWAEVAVEGIVLFERKLELSRLLAAIRRRILAGEVARHGARGHPYWVEARR